ncbi:MAG: 2-oxoglutarate ferredoxin oxidoreductase subunit alpha [candidate division Zixibacteria bacterium SM23_73]|nr:MAG: 2-oxoglutarate ferredoxin oxidoreductase subunit alpha [candidate division Zixibacteria bacterium SM23_73]
MKADPKGVLTGEHYLDGDHACAEGALAAGCRFLAGYPITPSTEMAERISERFPEVGGIFIQMEDELGSMAAVLGAAWGGAKSMTVTSGPGFSLMMENIGLAAMMEIPCVIVNVQRGGPSTGLPTLPGQADMMQARWGSHGDYEIIALSPNSPQECFEVVIEAANLSEKYRVPVMVMTDECVGHMTEKVVIPKADEIEIYPRRYTKLSPSKYLPFKSGEDLVPEMVKAGDGYKIHITGLTHDEKGYPVMSWETQEKLVRRLVEKIRLHADEIVHTEEIDIEDAEVVVLSYGISSRVAIPAIQKARKEGIKVGQLRLIIVWPFPEKKVRELAKKVKAFVVPEINYGQMVLEVERCAAGKAKAILVPHGGGWVHNPEDIYKAIKEAVK